MPSVINELIFDDIKSQLDQYGAFLLIDPAGLKADESLALRKEVTEAGGQLRQAKARVIRKAVPEDLADTIPAGGSLALVGAEDIAAVAKIINKLVKDDKIVVRAGMIDGKAYDAKGASRFADLPTKTEAQAMFVRAIRAPLVKLGRIAKAPTRRLGRALQAHKEKLEG